MSAKKAFDQYNKSFRHYQHSDDCQYKHGMIPLNECHCSCYALALFTAGYNAAKGIANKKEEA